MAAQLERDVPAQHVVSIADAAIGEKGLYVYLLVTAHPRSEHVWSFARHLGRSFSNEDQPDRRLEAIDPEGRPLVLLPMIYPMDFHIGFRTISFAHPGNWPVRSDDPSSGVVQLCMWRTKMQLSPGRYRMRLMPPRDDSDWVWDAVGGVHGDFEWREFDLFRVPPRG